MNERNSLIRALVIIVHEKSLLFLGESTLSELLRNKSSRTSDELINEIWGELTKFRGSAEQSDDMKMLLVKVK